MAADIVSMEVAAQETINEPAEAPAEKLEERPKRATRYGGERPPKRKLTPTPPPPPPTRPTQASSGRRGRPRKSDIAAREQIQEPVSGQSSPPPMGVEKGLPTKLREGHPLPTLSHPQTTSDGVFQSIHDSAVLATSIERSKKQWLADGGFFEKYWSKKKNLKNATEYASQPSRDTMTKLGFASVVIEPHVFEVTLYSVRESQMTFLPPVSQPPAQPMYHSFGPPQYAAPALPRMPPYAGMWPPQQPLHSATSGIRDSSGSSSPVSQFSTNVASQGSGQAQRPTPRRPGRQIPSEQVQNQALQPGQHPQNPPQSAAYPVVSSDPVIQMLAERASTDGRLKALMRDVAAGNASQAQLEEFQSHIEEFNNVIKQREASQRPQPSVESSSPDPLQQPPSPQPKASAANTTTATHSFSAQPSSAQPVVKQEPATAPTSFQPPISHLPPAPYTYTPPSYTKPTKPATAPRADVSAVVIEFHAGNGDRYVVPKHSVLEFLPGRTQVLVSFLVVRKGREIKDLLGKMLAADKKYEDETEYYQPVTVRLSSNVPKVLDTVEKVVAPLEESRKHMIEVMRRAKRVDDAFLATRLPVPENEAEREKRRQSIRAKTAESWNQHHSFAKEKYDAPSFMLPMRHDRK